MLRYKYMGHTPVLISHSSRAVLGESPVWDERTGTLYWVDIERGEIHGCREDGSQEVVRSLGERVGCIALRRDAPGFIAGLERRIALVSMDTLRSDSVAPFDSHPPGSRSNDGKCDPEGRFWVGTYDETSPEAHSWLYRCDGSGLLTRTLGPFVCTNGPAFSPDGGTLYCVDSYGRIIHRCVVSAAGELSDPRVFRRFETADWGYPDGLTCDLEGCLWVAHWGASRVCRYSPEGDLLDTIDLPVLQPTSCTFGGAAMRRLFITSAWTGLDSSSNGNRLAGAVFAVDLPVGGLPASRYAG